MSEAASDNSASTVVSAMRQRDDVAPRGKPFYITLLVVATIACSSSVIFLRLAHSPPIVVAAMRLWLAAILLLPVMLRQRRNWTGPRISAGQQVLRTLPASAALAIHLFAWAAAARMAPAASASLILNLSPIGLPFVLWIMQGERINRGELLGVAIAMAGVLGLLTHSFETGDRALLGELVCFGAMLLFCVYITFSRLTGNRMGLWMYVVPLYAMAGTFCLLGAVVMRVPGPEFSLREAGLMLGLAILPTVIGHSIMNLVIKHLRGPTVSMVSSLQSLPAALMGYIFLGEVPSPTLYLTGVLMIAGLVVVIRSAPPLPPPEPD